MILSLGFEPIDIDGFMIEASLLLDDGALFVEQVMNNEMLRRVVDNFLVVESKCGRTFYLL